LISSSTTRIFMGDGLGQLESKRFSCSKALKHQVNVAQVLLE